MRVVVVGAGPAGVRCAERITASAPDASVTLLGAEAALPYDRVALGKVLGGEAEPAALITHRVPQLRAARIAYRAAAPVAAIDRDAQSVVTASGERIAWDRLVLATGSQPVRLPLPGADRAGLFTYRSMADVQAIRRAANAGARRAVVIGGGLLGLEAAAALTALRLDVTVVHAVGWPMERQLDAEAGALLAASLGVAKKLRFTMPAQAAGFTPDALLLADGSRIAADIIVQAVGVRPDVALARAAGLRVNRGIVVDDALRTSDPRIQAIGECAEHAGVLCGLVAPALAMAEAAAMALAGHPAAYAARPDPAALKIAGMRVWSAGEIAPPDGEAITLNDAEAGCFRRLWVRSGKLVGAVLLGETDDAPFYLDLIGSGRPIAALRRVLAFGPAHLPVAA